MDEGKKGDRERVSRREMKGENENPSSDDRLLAGMNGRELKHSHRDKGKWRSITIAVPVESAQQL